MKSLNDNLYYGVKGQECQNIALWFEVRYFFALRCSIFPQNVV